MRVYPTRIHLERGEPTPHIECKAPNCSIPLTRVQIKRRSQYHSKQCASTARPPEFWREWASMGGKAGARSKQIRAIQRSLEKCGGKTPSEARAYRLGYDNGYSCGAKVGELRGYRKAWEEICNERKRSAA